MKIASLFTLSILLSVAAANTESNTHTTEMEGVECGLCMWGTEKIEEYLASNYTETKIESGITNLCNALPGHYSDLCVSVVVNNVPTIINDLEAYESPDTICKQIHVCTDSQLLAFHKYFSTPHMYGLMMYFKNQYLDHPDVREYILGSMHKYCF